MSSKAIVLVALTFALGVAGAGSAQVDPDLIGWWRLDEGRGSTAADLSRYGNNGTLVGGPSWVAGKVGTALAFDGLDDYVRCAERVGAGPGAFPAELMPETFAVACWTKLDSFAYFSSFVGNGIDTGSDECGFFLYNWGWVDENEKDFGLAIRTETAMSYVETPNVYETNVWYHVAATYDGTNVNVYVNGELAVGPTDVGGPMRWVSAASGNYPERFAIGVWLDPGYDLWVDGVIDDVRYYGRALDQSEINALMTADAYYPFAYGPTPKHGAMIAATSQVLQWSPGDSAGAHEVYFGEDLEAVAAATPDDADLFVGRVTAEMATVGTPNSPYPDGLVPGQTYFWRVDEVNDVHPDSPWKGDVWSFWVEPVIAYRPFPVDTMKNVDPDQDLTWEAGAGTLFHTVYFGKTFEEVDGALAGGWMSATATYDPGTLELDTTYYWRVDEFTGLATNRGQVWRFTTRGEGGGVEAEYFAGMELAGDPVLARIEPTINHNWSGEVVAGLEDQVSARWRANLEAPFTEPVKLITTSDDGVRLWVDGRLIIDNWTDHGTTHDSALIDMQAGQVHLVVMEWYENTGGAVAQLSWQSDTLPRQIIPQGWLQLPLKATSPSPANGAPHVDQNSILSWAAGDDATGHQVYFGDDAEAVANADPSTPGIYRGQQGADVTTYNPGPLEWGKTYYWRVDEVNPGGVLAGALWSFTAADFIIIDDFESYDNEVGSRPFEVWIDGIGFSQPAPGNPGNGSNAAVGHDIWSSDSPHYNGLLMETRSVHGGFQSMPIDYNNVISPNYSEIERTWVAPQNWTVNGVDTLTLHVRGSGNNDEDRFYVKLTDSTGGSATVEVADRTFLTSREWSVVGIPMADFAGVNASAIERIVVGLGNPPAVGGAGSLLFDDFRVTKSAAP